MPDQSMHYVSYLLRFWQEESQTPHHSAVWRFSLENVQTGARHGFSDFETLIAFLYAQLASAPPYPDVDVPYDD